MHVTQFDSNTLSWYVTESPGEAPFGPETALEWCCAANGGPEPNPDERPGEPVGPIRYWGEQDLFCLLSAWSGGRQWYEMLTIFSAGPVSDEVRQAALAESGIDEGFEEEEDEEDE